MNDNNYVDKIYMAEYASEDEKIIHQITTSFFEVAFAEKKINSSNPDISHILNKSIIAFIGNYIISIITALNDDKREKEFLKDFEESFNYYLNIAKQKKDRK